MATARAAVTARAAASASVTAGTRATTRASRAVAGSARSARAVAARVRASRTVTTVRRTTSTTRRAAAAAVVAATATAEAAAGATTSPAMCRWPRTTSYIPVAGILDILDNYAFIRTSGYLPGPNDVYVSLAQVRKNGLRKGDHVTGAVRQPKDGERREKFNALVRLDSVNGMAPESGRGRPEFRS